MPTCTTRRHWLISSLALAMCAPVFAGDLWEITSSSVAPDGSTIPFTQKQCVPNNGMDPSAMLAGLGTCTMNQKSGNASAMTFAMTCKTPGMPAGLDGMKVTGDAKMSGDRFDMRYAISLVGAATQQAGGDFKMNGSAQARKVGSCTER